MYMYMYKEYETVTQNKHTINLL